MDRLVKNWSLYGSWALPVTGLWALFQRLVKPLECVLVKSIYNVHIVHGNIGYKKWCFIYVRAQKWGNMYVPPVPQSWFCHQLCKESKDVTGMAPVVSPVKNFSSQLTHWELTLKLVVISFWGHSIGSQWIHTVSLLWAFHEFATHITVRWSPVSSLF